MAKISEFAVCFLITILIGLGFVTKGWIGFVLCFLGGMSLGFYKDLIIDNYKAENEHE